MTNKINVLSTKKLIPNQKQVLIDAGFNVVDEDFISIIFKTFDWQTPPSGVGGLIFTSQNAVQSVLKTPKVDELKSISCFCVGSKTKSFLEQNGFTVEAYAGYASDLAEIISLVYPKNNYTFFSGNLRRDILPEMLKEAGVKLDEIEVYETILSPKKMDGHFDAILFFSPSGVESYLTKNKISKELCFAIGETTAEALENKKVKNIVIADKPSVESVIAEVIEYY